MTPIPRRLWQIAGVLGIVHVVLIPVGIALQRSPLFEEGTRGIRESYVEGDLSRTLTGWLRGVVRLPAPHSCPGVPGPGTRTAYGGRRLGRADRPDVRDRLRHRHLRGRLPGRCSGDVRRPARPRGRRGLRAEQPPHLRLLPQPDAARRKHPRDSTVRDRRRCPPTLVRRLRRPHRPSPCSSRRRSARSGTQDLGTLVWMVWFTGVCVLMLRHQEPASIDRPASVPTSVGVGHA